MILWQNKYKRFFELINDRNISRIKFRASYTEVSNALDYCVCNEATHTLMYLYYKVGVFVSELFDYLGNDVVDKYKKFHALLDFMNSKDNSHMWPRTLQYLDNMDSIRQTNWKNVLLDYDKA